MAEWKSKITDEQLELTVAECDPRKTGAGGWESVSKDSLWSLAYELLQHRRNAARADVQGGWIPVEKALPDNSDPVLVFQGNASHMRRVAYYDTIGATGWRWCGFDGEKCDPDAWMKIPPYNSAERK